MSHGFRTIFCDIGGVILREDDYYPLLLRGGREALAEEGIVVTDAVFSAAVEHWIRSFVPSTRQAVVWQFTKPDVEKCNRTVARLDAIEVGPRRLVDGVRDVLATLADSYTLILAANAATPIKAVLAEHDVLQFFSHPEVSEDIGFSKPDTRFFEYLLRKHALDSGDVIMIGDRLDNDIIPARLMGMGTVLVRTGVYAILEPRTPREIPDATVSSVQELPAVIGQLCRQ